MSRFFLLLITIFVLGILAATAAQPSNNFYIIYDSSNSMWGALQDDARKYEAGRKALANFLNQDFGDRKIGFRAYGHREKANCRDTELIVPFSAAASARGKIETAVNDIRPTGKTPITYSLQEALKDFDGQSGDILLVSDGIETCDKDPCALMQEWQASQVNIRVHVVGVGLQEFERKALACIADATGGQYFDVDTEEKFAEALAGARTAAAEPQPAPKPSDDHLSYALQINATDENGRSYIVTGTLLSADQESIVVGSHRRNVVETPGDYVLEVGPVLADGSIYKPVQKEIKIETPGTTVVDILVTQPAIVSAVFKENGEEHRGSLVTAYQDGKEVFRFRSFDEALARPGAYEFRATPNADNELTVAETLVEGQHTELLFDLVKTMKNFFVFKLSNGDVIRRNSELWADGKKVYKVHSRNGALVRPGTYQLRSEDQNAPLIPVDVVVDAPGETHEIPLDIGFIEITYAPSEDSYVGDPDRAFIHSDDRGGSSYARIDTPIFVAPGAYTIKPRTTVGYFDDQTVTVAANQSVNVTFTPKRLGAVLITYAPSDKYLRQPDRAFVSPLEDQQLINGYVNPGKPLRLLPGRYRVEAWQYAGEVPSQEFTVTAGETTEIVLSPAE